MNRRLRRDAILADLASAEAMFEALPETDPVGRLGMRRRIEALRSEVKDLDKGYDTLASVALFFGGDPVVGSRSIDAEFASHILDAFQDMVSKRVAFTIHGSLQERGRIPGKSASRLAITNVLHGSFGFLLEEEDPDGDPMFPTVLREALAEVSTLLERVVASSDETFDELLETLDGRLFGSVRRFFQEMYDKGATARVVESEREVTLDRLALERAFRRVERANITEQEIVIDGQLLGVLPIGRTFEVRRFRDQEVIRGRIDPEFTDSYLEQIHRDRTPLGKPAHIRLRERIVEKPGSLPKSTYTLIGFTVIGGTDLRATSPHSRG